MGEERYQTLYELASDAFLNVLPNGEIITANIAAADLLGYTVGELIGMTGANDIIAPEVFEETEQAWREQLEERGQFRVDTLWVRKDGSRVPVAVSGKTLMVGDQQQLQIIGRDITERKQAEETLRESEQLFRTIADTSGAAIIFVDETSIHYANPAAERVTGYTRSELQHTSLQQIVHAEDFDRIYHWNSQILRGTEIADPYLFRIVRKDGAVRWLEAQSTPMVHEGRIVNLSVGVDATERVLAEEALRESEERFRHLYTATPAMLHSIDRDGRIVSVSDYWLEVLGYDRSGVIGRKSVEFLTEESRRYAEEVVLPDFWERGSCRDVHYLFVRKDGEIVDILLSAIAEQDKDGNPYRTLAVLTDITEQKRLEEQLQNAREVLEGKVERQMLRRNPHGLTFRELTILHLLAAGRSDKEIAAELVISPLTVQKHVSNILGKMDAASRTEAATRALREGLLE